MILNRKRKTKDPCANCRLHRERCICALIPKLKLKTRVSLIVHAKELKRTTNTGTLALHALENSQMYVRGEGRTPLDLSAIPSDQFETYLLYPSEDAASIESLTPKKPVHLIVPDGNWRQASKVHTRHAELKNLPRVKIGQQNLAENHLRKEHMNHGLSTLEAIALALKHFEGPEIGAQLLSLYQAKLKATLAGRGLT